MRKQLSEEQKTAKKIAKIVNDITLDLDEVGRAIVDIAPTVSYNRLVLLTEAAVEHKEQKEEGIDVRQQSNSIFQ